MSTRSEATTSRMRQVRLFPNLRHQKPIENVFLFQLAQHPIDDLNRRDGQGSQLGQWQRELRDYPALVNKQRIFARALWTLGQPTNGVPCECKIIIVVLHQHAVEKDTLTGDDYHPATWAFNVVANNKRCALRQPHAHRRHRYSGNLRRSARLHAKEHRFRVKNWADWSRGLWSNFGKWDVPTPSNYLGQSPGKPSTDFDRCSIRLPAQESHLLLFSPDEDQFARDNR